MSAQSLVQKIPCAISVFLSPEVLFVVSEAIGKNPRSNFCLRQSQLSGRNGNLTIILQPQSGSVSR